MHPRGGECPEHDAVQVTQHFRQALPAPLAAPAAQGGTVLSLLALNYFASAPAKAFFLLPFHVHDGP